MQTEWIINHILVVPGNNLIWVVKCHLTRPEEAEAANLPVVLVIMDRKKGSN